MTELPNWAWYALALIGSVFVLGYLRALAAVAEDTLSVHNLRHEAADLQILQIKQLKAIHLGVHPGDVFGPAEQLDRLIAEAKARIQSDPDHDRGPAEKAFPDIEIIEDGVETASEPDTQTDPETGAGADHPPVKMDTQRKPKPARRAA